MATHKSAAKRHKQSIKRNERNRSARSEIRTTIKTTLKAAETGSKEEALAGVKRASTLLDKAVVHGLHHRNNAARRISRLTQTVNKLMQASS